MRRIFSFNTPTLLISLVTQILGSLLLWLSYLPIADQTLAAAPITPSGLNTQVNLAPTPPPGKVQYDITGGTRAGTNLFHSFGDFNVPTNNIANFLNTPVNGVLPSTSNILGRVTGGNPSTIFGMIQTTGFGNANLFLMNPYGFLFGPNATLNVGGMVAFTTADYLRLRELDGSNAGIFHANAAQTSILTSAPVVAFGFLGSNPAAIALQGSILTVQPGQSISLVGGNQGFTYTNPDTDTTASVPGGVTMTGGKLLAPGGQINIASVASPGEVLASNLQLQANLNGASFTSLGNVSIGQNARIDTAGATPGTIMIRGGQLLVADGATITSAASSDPLPPVGSVTINGTGVQLTGSDVALSGTNVSVTGSTVTATNLDGSGGTIALTAGSAGNVTVTRGALLDASGNGGGTVTVRGGQFLLDNSTISANVTGPGPVINEAESIGGGIDIQVNQKAVIQNLGVLETNVAGNATPGVTYGGVHVKADTIEVLGTVSLEDAFSGAGDLSAFTGIRSDVGFGSTGGNSGPITLEANSILINNFAQLTSTSQGAGNSSNITVKTTENLVVDFGFIGSVTNPPSTGDAGNIELTSTQGNISLTNFSFVTSQVIDSPGTAGSLTLSAPSGNILLADSLLGTYLQPPINADGVPAIRTGGSGGILINANNLQLNGGDIGIVNLSNLPSGDLTVNVSGSLTLQGGSFSPPSSIHASSVGLIQADGSITGAASSAGLNITAHDILITDGSSLTTDTNSSGAAGPLNISAVNLQLTNGGQIASKSRLGIDPQTGLPLDTRPSGPAGTVTIQGLTGPADSVLIDGAGSGISTTTVGTGAGGSINISVHSLTVQNGGTLSAASSGTAPSATGGTILVNADTVTLATGGTMTAASTGLGASGEVVVQGLASPAQSIVIDGAGSGIFTNTSGTGPGGDIHLSANSVTLQNGGILSATTSGTSPSAIGGSISVNATDGVTMTNGGSITASSSGPGNAGNISIDAGQQLLMQDSSITTQATQAGGGNINIQAVNLLNMGNSEISTSVLGGGGSGGNITIDPNAVVLQNSQILAQAVQGSGGNISITTNLLLADINSTISASSQFGQNGTITIQSPISPASGKILPLSNRPLLATSLTNQRCAALAGGNFSSFTVAGRDSLPAEPGGWLSTPLALASSEPGGGTLTKFGSSLSEGESGEETPLLSLRQIAPPGFLTQTFAVESSAGCTS